MYDPPYRYLGADWGRPEKLAVGTVTTALYDELSGLTLVLYI